MSVIKVANAQQAAEVVADQALLAAKQGTFAVGGAIIENATGRVVQAMHNNVLLDPPPAAPGVELFRLSDPTAHGERQLVDWYFDNKLSRKLPEPEKLTVVTSLDPCAMCTGALLTGGFNVAVSALDDYAGINWNGTANFPTLPKNLRQIAQQRFGYYAVGAPFDRAYQGGPEPVFASQSIGSRVQQLTSTIFLANVERIRASVADAGLDPGKLSNPADLPQDSPVIAALRKIYPDALRVASDDPRYPGQELAAPLVKVAKDADAMGGFNAVAMLDPFGNVLLCIGGNEATSLIRTAFLRATRAYATVRYELMNADCETTCSQAHATLGDARHCTFVSLYTPDPALPEAVMTFGAYGSTMEGPIPRVFPSSYQYVLTQNDATDKAVAQLASKLPPLYRDAIQIAPQRVLDGKLIDSARKLL